MVKIYYDDPNSKEEYGKFVEVSLGSLIKASLLMQLVFTLIIAAIYGVLLVLL